MFQSAKQNVDDLVSQMGQVAINEGEEEVKQPAPITTAPKVPEKKPPLLNAPKKQVEEVKRANPMM